METFLTRRGFLVAAGAAASTLRFARAATTACTLTPEGEEGPYYVNDEQLRRDLTEGKPGVPLQLRVAIVDSRSCEPISGAAVDIWHCDALGEYSNFGGAKSANFLRGVQLAGSNGIAEFSTLYPGWYQGRATHIHVKVHIGGAAAESRYAGGHIAHTGQLYFPEDINADIAKLDPYTRHSQVHRTLNAEDGIFRSQHGADCLASLERLSPRTNESGFRGLITVAVNPEATPAPIGFGGRGGRGRRPGPPPSDQ